MKSVKLNDLLVVIFNGNDLNRNHLYNTLESLYGAAQGYDEHAEDDRAILERPHETMLDVTMASWEPALRLLAPRCEIVLASNLETTGSGQDQLLGICHEVGADRYLSGAFGKEYLDESRFRAEGIHVQYHEYEYPEYPQRFGDFVPFLSYVDLLFNAGLDLALIESGARKPGSGDEQVSE
mgnify:CR=1 FL=1